MRTNAAAADSARTERASVFDLELVPPWLASLVIHMCLTLVLGLLVQRAVTEPGLDITLSNGGDMGLSEFDAGGGGSGDPLAESIGLPAIDDPLTAAKAAAAVPLEGIIEESVDGIATGEAPEYAFAEEAASLFAASTAKAGSVGEGGTGSGSGGGDGAGVGTGRGDGRGPGQAITSMFGLAGEGGDFVYVFDRSDSMNYVYTLEADDAIMTTVTPLEAAKNELSRSLGDLKADCRFQVVFYNDSAVAFGNSSELFAATPSNITRVREFINNMAAEMGTNHLSGLEQAIKTKPQVIFVLTDAEEKDDPSFEVIRALALQCKRAKIKINIVHFCSQARSDSTLRQLARLTKGQHRFITLRELAIAKLKSKYRSNPRAAREAISALD
ncbi:VWA domain-containing protein [Lacipirellula sp.]|uniref:VWA domain-containing protein n=1 Tax=Lacipirellula sp. TaxID=2691419 RepID=UPI003D127CB4